MKRSFAVNFNGSIRYFDEDAYALMKDYLDSIRKAFDRTGETEIASDIEARIEEIIAENHAPDTIVTIEDVRSIIVRMGEPEQLTEGPVEEDATHAGSTPPPYRGTTAVPPPYREDYRPSRRLYRDPRNAVLGGVLSGLANYLNSKDLTVRIVFVVLSCITGGGVAICLYIIGWILIPAAVTPAQRLEMCGKAVNVSNVGQTVLDDNYSASNPLTRRRAIEATWRIISVGFKAFLGFIGFAVFWAAIIPIVNAIWGLLGYITPGTFIDFFDGKSIVFEDFATASPSLFFWSMLLIGVALLIPAISAVWVALAALFKTPTASKRTVMILLIIEGIIIGALIVLYFVSCMPAVAV